MFSRIVQILNQIEEFGNGLRPPARDLVFPFEDRDDYKASIRFQTYSNFDEDGNDTRVTPSSFLTAIERFADGNLQEAREREDAANAETEEEIRGVNRNRAENIIENREAFVEFLGSNRTNPGDAYYRRTTGKLDEMSVNLYMPQQIQFRDAASYNNINLGAVGAMAEAGVAGGMNGNTAAAAVQGGIQGLKAMFQGQQSMGGEALSRVIAAGVASKINDTAGGIARGTTRTTINPNARTLFEAPIIREFNFTFRLIPSSRQEAEEINKIVKYFRSELYPTEIFLEQGGVSVGYEFPKQFQITLLHRGQEIPNTKILPCYLTSCSTTHNPTQMGMFYNGQNAGYFNETTIDLVFREVRALSKFDVDNETINSISVPEENRENLDPNPSLTPTEQRYGQGVEPAREVIREDGSTYYYDPEDYF